MHVLFAPQPPTLPSFVSMPLFTTRRPSTSLVPSSAGAICKLHSVVLIPDHFAPATPPWYADLSSHLPDVSLHPLPMPNPYESNSKRWESVWLSVIRAAVEAKSVSLVAHGTGADACLRYLENHQVHGGVVILCATGDEYFAGERHGRPYHWQLIRENTHEKVALIVSPKVADAENEKLKDGLKPVILRTAHANDPRLTRRDDASEIAELVKQIAAR